MGAGYLALQLILVFVLTAFLLNKYANFRKQHLMVLALTFIGWYFSFLIIFILPLDIAITFYRKCQFDEDVRHNESLVKNLTFVPFDCDEPKGIVSDNTLLSTWRVLYWLAQLLTWIVLPMMQSYANAGDFTAAGKLKTAFYNNALYYGSYGVIFIFLVIYAVGKGVSLSFEHLKILLISASNTWGLFILVVLLGYGLVEVPRQLWQTGNRDYRMNKAYFDIDKLSTDKNDAEEAITEVYLEAKAALDILQNQRGTARHKAQIVVSKFPPEFVDEVNESKRSGSNYRLNRANSVDANVVSNEKYLIRLHKRVIDAIQNYGRTQAQWREAIVNALYLEDVDQAKKSGHFESKHSKRLPFEIPGWMLFLWHVRIKRFLFHGFGAFCIFLTLLIMWSECTFFIVSPQLSLAARIVRSAADGSHYKYIQIITIALISYLGICAYYTVFKLRVYRYYHLDPHHMTDENSLLFSAMLICRLTPPICLNFLGMIHLDSHITSGAGFGVETQFTKLMGHLDVLPIIARGINIYLPIFIVLLAMATWFRLGTRLMHSLGIDQFLDNDDISAEMVQGGKSLVALERNKINRGRSREERHKRWNEKTTTSTSSKFMSQNYDDKTPIMEYQENPAFDENEVVSSDSSFYRVPLTSVPSNDQDYPETGALLGLSSSFNHHTTDRPKGHHPTPSNIFDDL